MSRAPLFFFGAIIGAASTGAPAAADTWPTYADETATRLIADSTVGAGDVQEKDYAWGDVDKDGDIDLVCVRKEPWNTPGRFRNVLFMNEGPAEGHLINGVLVDRTLEYASAATDGGQGFLDLTADRDVALIDVDGDGWLDIVTATTYGTGLPKTISHPRVYINLKNDAGGNWLGFRYEEPRTPTMPIIPNFCGIGFGDVDGDDRPDLYFVEYSNTLEDRLWINDGAGNFTDESEARLSFTMRESDFGVHAVIADLNGDGVNDIVKDRASTTTTPPLRVSLSYNNLGNEGVFNAFEVMYNGNPYHVDVADLNNDGKLDIIVEDDSADRYFLNQGNGPDGLAEFIQHTFSTEADGFGGNIVVRDIDKDGFKDVLIADVDVDCCGCTRFMRMWRNKGDLPDVTFEPQTGGIPVGPRTGTHDVAVFDINGDEWLDLVIGTCTGTSVWIAQPELVFSYPLGLPPAVVPPDEPFSFQVQIQTIGTAQVQAGSALLLSSVNGGPFASSAMAELGADLYLATLPATACPARFSFYVSATMAGGGTTTDPPTAPSSTFSTVVAAGTEVVISDPIEGDVSGWTITSDPSLTAGEWEQADPNGTISSGELAAPEDDATPGAGNVMAFVTDNGPPGGVATANDVDGGPTRLVSPQIDLSGGDGVISYQRWLFSSGGVPDVLTVEVSNNDGASWTLVETVSATGSAWEAGSFVVSQHVAPTAQVRVRFSACDCPNDSVTEAGIDDFQVDRFICLCPTDINGDGATNVLDLIELLLCFGQPATPPCDAADINTDATVNVLDLIELLLAFGTACP